MHRRAGDIWSYYKKVTGRTKAGQRRMTDEEVAEAANMPAPWDESPPSPRPTPAVTTPPVPAPATAPAPVSPPVAAPELPAQQELPQVFPEDGQQHPQLPFNVPPQAAYPPANAPLPNYPTRSPNYGHPGVAHAVPATMITQHPRPPPNGHLIPVPASLVHPAPRYQMAHQPWPQFPMQYLGVSHLEGFTYGVYLQCICPSHLYHGNHPTVHLQPPAIPPPRQTGDAPNLPSGAYHIQQSTAPVASGSRTRDVAPPVTVAQDPSVPHLATEHPGPAQVQTHNAPSQSRQDIPPVADPSTQIAPPLSVFSFRSDLQLPQRPPSPPPRRTALRRTTHRAPVAGPSSRPISTATTQEQSFATGSSRPRPVDPDVRDDNEERPRKRPMFSQTRDDTRETEAQTQAETKAETETETPVTEPVLEEETNTTEAVDVPPSSATAQVNTPTRPRANAENQTAAADNVDEKKADDPPATLHTPRWAPDYEDVYYSSESGVRTGPETMEEFFDLPQDGYNAVFGGSPSKLLPSGDNGNGSTVSFSDDEDGGPLLLLDHRGPFPMFNRLSRQESVEPELQPAAGSSTLAQEPEEEDYGETTQLNRQEPVELELQPAAGPSNLAHEPEEEDCGETRDLESHLNEDEEGNVSEEEKEKKKKKKGKGKAKAKATKPKNTSKGKGKPKEKKATDVAQEDDAQEDDAQEVNAQEINARPNLRRSSRNKGKQRA